MTIEVMMRGFSKLSAHLRGATHPGSAVTQQGQRLLWFHWRVILLTSLFFGAILNPPWVHADPLENALVNKYRALDQYYLEKKKRGRISDEEDNRLRQKILSPAEKTYQKELQSWKTKLLKKYNLKEVTPKEMEAIRLKERMKQRDQDQGVKSSEKGLKKLTADEVRQLQEKTFVEKNFKPLVSKENQTSQNPASGEKKTSPSSEPLVLDGSEIPEYIEFKKENSERAIASEKESESFKILNSTDPNLTTSDQEVIEFQQNKR